MRQILILIGALLITLGLHAETYTRVQCKVGNDTITLPVPSKYIIVGRDVAWAAKYFRQVENIMTDPQQNNTIVLGLASRDMYDFCQKGGELYGFACEVQCLNKVSKIRLKKKDIPIVMYYAEKEFREVMSNFKNTKYNTNNNEGASVLTSRQKLFESQDATFIGKSDRHITFALYLRADQIVRLCSLVIVDGKAIYLYLTKPDTDALAGVGEMNNWVEEIKNSTSASDG